MTSHRTGAETMGTTSRIRLLPFASTQATLRQRDLWLGALLLAIGYFLGVKAGMVFKLESAAVSILWPPNALVVAALLLTPVTQWWVMVMAVLPAHLLAQLSAGVPFGMTFLWWVSNCTEGLIAAGLLLYYLGGPPKFGRVRDVAAFLLIAVVFSPAVTSFLDCGFIAFEDWRYTDYWDLWHTRFLSNALAELTLVPLVVFWFHNARRFLERTNTPQYAELALLFSSLAVVSIYVFRADHASDANAGWVFAPVPFLIWAAIRQGVAGVTTGVALVSTFAITGLVSGHGPFASHTPDSAANSLQLFLLLFASSLMLLAASFAELRSTRSLAIRHKESLRLALGAARAGTWEWDMINSQIVWRTSEETDGSESSEEPVADLLRRVHPEDLTHVQCAMDEVLSGQAPREIEFRFRCHADEFRWVSAKGSTTLHVGGKPTRMIGVFIDSTERHLQLRNAQSQQEQLTHLSRVATLGELSGAFAHELGQPLTSIIINAQAAREMVRKMMMDYSEIDEALVDIVTDGRRAAEVIDRLRALFRKGPASRETLNVNDCIRDVLRLEHSALVMRSVSTELNLKTDLKLISADRIQLAQVLLNIITNACHAMEDVEQKRRKLTVATCNASTHVLISVRDTGPGIPDPEIVFEPFFSTKRDGIGLGLPICRTIISAHGGKLWATNHAEGGASFNIELPIQHPSQPTHT